ncbi:Uncharacterised protein [Vibrio cholerae]|nr:Uncharacterised protein [Vibrio cholerae]
MFATVCSRSANLLKIRFAYVGGSSRTPPVKRSA